MKMDWKSVYEKNLFQNYNESEVQRIKTVAPQELQQELPTEYPCSKIHSDIYNYRQL